MFCLYFLPIARNSAEVSLAITWFSWSLSPEITGLQTFILLFFTAYYRFLNLFVLIQAVKICQILRQSKRYSKTAIQGGLSLPWKYFSLFVSCKPYAGIHSAASVISSSKSACTAINLLQLKPSPLTLSDG